MTSATHFRRSDRHCWLQTWRITQNEVAARNRCARFPAALRGGELQGAVQRVIGTAPNGPRRHAVASRDTSGPRRDAASRAPVRPKNQLQAFQSAEASIRHCPPEAPYAQLILARSESHPSAEPPSSGARRKLVFPGVRPRRRGPDVSLPRSSPSDLPKSSQSLNSVQLCSLCLEFGVDTFSSHFFSPQSRHRIPPFPIVLP